MIEKFNAISGIRFWREFQTTGILHADLGEATSSLIDDPRVLIEHVLGDKTTFIRSDALVSGKDSNATGNEIAYATAPSGFFPPHLKFFVIPNEASSKVTLKFLDSWHLLQDSENRSMDFYSGLFNRLRMMRFSKAVWIAPTFTIRNNCLIFAQPPLLGQKDKMGERVRSWTGNREPIEIELNPGEMIVIDNHRFAHCIDPSGSLDGAESYSTWIDRQITKPNDTHIKAARDFQNKIAALHPFENSDTMKLRLGLMDCKLEDYIRASLNNSMSMDELMKAYKQLFDLLYLS